MEGRGPAVVSESLNSNTINIATGVCLPALIFGLGGVSKQGHFTMWWLLGMTLTAMLVAGRQHGLRRSGGVALIVLYLIFAGMIAFWK